MNDFVITLIFFFYGLAFFSMGLIIAQERGRGSDERLQHALRPLAAFGLMHGFHEWIEMFEINNLLPGQTTHYSEWAAFRLAVLVLSFLSLTAFGSSLLARSEERRRLSMLVPLLQVAIWGFGLLSMRDNFPTLTDMWNVADVWTRYVIAIPGAMMASIGLIFQQREFRLAGMAKFGRDSLWAAIAFGWYGVIGQVFTKPSLLPPSTVINSNLFYSWFGFPVQLLRGLAAVVVAIFVTRFLRSFEVETKEKIAELQAERLKDAQRREAMRGELFKRVVAAQEAERERIARELHDETGQALTAIGLGMRGIASSIDPHQQKTIKNLKEIEQLAVRSLDELRRLIADLRPTHLDDLGLAAALRWYSGEISNRTSLNIHIDLPFESTSLSSSHTTALFRVAQEAFTNVIKHANATNIWVELNYLQDWVILKIRDDGDGFNQEELASSQQPIWGILGMQERASLTGGLFSLTSAPGSGTIIEVKFPQEEEK